MEGLSGGRSSVARSLGRALIQIGAAALLLGGVEIVEMIDGPLEPRWVLVLFTIVGWIYIGAGLIAWRRRPSNRMGGLLVAAGFLWLAVNLANTQFAVLIAVGTVLATVPLAVVIHLLHAFPSGRLPPGWSPVIVVAGYVVALILQAPLYLFAPAPSPYHILGISNRPEMVSLGTWVQRISGVVVVVATAVVLASRWHRADPTHRRVMGPLFAFGIVAVLFIPISAIVIWPWSGWSPESLAGAQLVVFGLVPVAFALSVLRGGFARTGEIDELGAWLGAVEATRPQLVEALAHTLGDPSLQLVFWVPDRDEYVDATGAAVTLPAPASGRSAVDIDLSDRRVGAIIYDAELIADPEPVRAAGRVVAIAVDHHRLTAELLASQEALRLSRARIVEAADRERRRIAQNLHDGLQVRLVLLGIEAQAMAGDDSASPAVQREATLLRAGIDAAATELRQLVHAVMPSALIERGLSAATEDLVDRMPVPTRLDVAVADGTLPATVESTAYFVVAEGLANAVKHSRAHNVDVRLASEGGHLVVEVDDDGVGGAAPGGGAGLRGLADRIDVLGGRLHIDSPHGGGTHLVAELPCGS